MFDSIFVALSSFAEYNASVIEIIKSSDIPYKIHSSGKRITREELLENAANLSVIIASVESYDDSLLAVLPQLKCIVRLGVGVDSVDLVSAPKRNITVLNTPDIPTTVVAELAMAMYFSLSRNLRPQANSMAPKKWERLESHLLSGKTIGIIGFGRIGKKIAAFCKPFGVTILVCDPFVSTESVADENIQLVDKNVLLSKSDIVSILASKTGSDGLIIAAGDYTKMKKGVILVNLSRGGMIDEDGLVDALASKYLAGAGLDVFGKEPYNGPLCNFENVILIPHSATLTVETRIAMETECVDKALRFLTNRLLPNEKVV